MPRPTLTNTAPGLTAAKNPGVEQPAGRVGPGQHAGDRIRPAGELVEPLDRMELVDVLDRLAHVALDGQHRHPERLGEPRDLGPDRPGADDQQRLPAQLAARLLLGRPVAPRLVALHPRQALGEGQQPHERELGQRDRRGRRSPS